MLPITTGVFPFGLVMGTIYFHSQVTEFEALLMNVLVFGGASQVAVIDLMLNRSSLFVVILTGLIINLRFMLYSAAFAHFLQGSSVLVKVFCAYGLTDQTYATFKANEPRLKNKEDVVSFYMGSAVCMLITWHGSTALGFFFGNFLPKELSLDYAIPLSFVALAMPAIKNSNYLYVAMFASVSAIILKGLPYNLGLLCATLLAMAFGGYLTRPRQQRPFASRIPPGSETADLKDGETR